MTCDGCHGQVERQLQAGVLLVHPNGRQPNRRATLCRRCLLAGAWCRAGWKPIAGGTCWSCLSVEPVDVWVCVSTVERTGRGWLVLCADCVLDERAAWTERWRLLREGGEEG